jgi:hypothetical protein
MRALTTREHSVLAGLIGTDDLDDPAEMEACPDEDEPVLFALLARGCAAYENSPNGDRLWEPTSLGILALRVARLSEVP